MGGRALLYDSVGSCIRKNDGNRKGTSDSTVVLFDVP